MPLDDKGIERDEQMDRDYIPLPGGWEFQTRGRGSTARLLDTKTGERFPIALPDCAVQFFERMAREVYAAAEQARADQRERDAEICEALMKDLRAVERLESIGCETCANAIRAGDV